jgi:hypothetical protein
MPKCKIFEESKYHFFLKDLGAKNTYYDIVMPKEFCDGKNFKLGDIISVQVDGINIANDGTPGAFVKPN